MQMDHNDQMIAQRAETLRLSGAYEQAIEVFEQLEKKYPENAWVNAHLGTIYYQLMDYGKAEDYLKTSVAKNNKYLWAHAQLGETYRLRAIVENRSEEYIRLAIEHFKTALGAELPENSNYGWALAHLGATYRLEMTRNIEALRTRKLRQLSKEDPLEHYKSKALECLNRALELLPTYTWAWGMRATVYRLAQEYEDSFWDLGVETIIAPEIEVLQHSSSPVPVLESGWVNLHEHAFLSFYLTKIEDEIQKKKRHYGRAIAFAQKSLILQPGDLIAQLMLTVIEANQKKEEQGGTLSNSNDIHSIKGKLAKFFEDAESEFFEVCAKVLQHLIEVGRVSQDKLEKLRSKAGEEHKLTQLILKDVIESSSVRSENDDPQLWLWKNFALTETSTSVLWLLSDLSEILQEDRIIGTAEPYRELAGTINPFYALERLYQTPVFSEEERVKIFNDLSNVIAV